MPWASHGCSSSGAPMLNFLPWTLTHIFGFGIQRIRPSPPGSRTNWLSPLSCLQMSSIRGSPAFPLPLTCRHNVLSPAQVSTPTLLTGSWNFFSFEAMSPSHLVKMAFRSPTGLALFMSTHRLGSSTDRMGAISLA